MDTPAELSDCTVLERDHAGVRDPRSVVEQRTSAAALLGHLLAHQRTSAGLTQERVAELAEMSVRGLRNIELGLVARPRRKTIAALADALGLDAHATALVDNYLHLAGAENNAEDIEAHYAPSHRASSTLPVAPRHYVGRARIVSTLDRWLSSGRNNGPAVVVLEGAPGIGKTALALHVADRTANAFPDGQHFIDLSREHNAADVLPRVLRMISVGSGQIPSGLHRQLELYHGALASRRLLLIAKNPSAKQVRWLTPTTLRSKLIATSLSRLVLPGEGARIVLGRLSPPEALEFLAQTLGKQRVYAELGGALRIVEYCEGSPLALRIARDRLAAHPYRRLDWLAGRLAQGTHRLDELTVDDINAVRPGSAGRPAASAR